MSIVSRDVELKADSGKVTLGDLRHFIAALENAGAADVTPVSGRVNFGGTLKSLKATAVRFGDGTETQGG